MGEGSAKKFFYNGSVVTVSASYSSYLQLLAPLTLTPSPLTVPQSYFLSRHVFSGVLQCAYSFAIW